LVRPVQAELQGSSRELGKVHRLAHIAICPEVIAADDVGLLATGCQYDYRETLCPCIRAHAAQHLESCELDIVGTVFNQQDDVVLSNHFRLPDL
jgi:hypothetical protein